MKKTDFFKTFCGVVIVLLLSLYGIFCVIASAHAQMCDVLLIPAQDLYEGTTSPEVMSIQHFLNLDPATEVAADGPGSRGMETMYFGERTFDAVERFQEKYYDQILTPLHLKAPTGRVGRLTRLAIGRICIPL